VEEVALARRERAPRATHRHEADDAVARLAAVQGMGDREAVADLGLLGVP
jgi:hypothetical protein